jgi:hypothetical protein
MAINRPVRPARRPPPARPGFFWSRLHFLIRFLGLTGFLVACVGLVLAGLDGVLASWSAARDAVVDAYGGNASLGTWLLLGGSLAALFALLVEVLVIVRLTAGRRSAFGLNAVVQAALAAALFVGINAWSFQHFIRFDWTRTGQFTLPEKVRQDLQQLDPTKPTLVVIYQRHKLFGDLSDRAPDDYDNAAERKVEEKVKDLVDQFRELGPQFQVETLDVARLGYRDQLQRVTQDAPALRRAIESAPANAIFLYSGGQVQQLGFNEFFLLDRVASQEANGGRGNLVLLAQGAPKEGEPFSGRGVEPFAHKLLNLEEHKPRIGVLVMHELLTTEGSEGAFALRGLRKTLERHGFEVRDVVLRRFTEGGQPEPAADTAAESKLDRLDADLEDSDSEIKALEEEIKRLQDDVAEFELKPGEKEEDKLAALSKTYARELGGRPMPAEVRRTNLAIRQAKLIRGRALLEARQRERDELRQERARLPVDELQETRRMKDVKGKLDRALADCDLLLIPRLTRRSNGSLAAPYRFHRFSEAQLASIREFVQEGKPIFACLGPSTEPAELGLPPDFEEDGFDRFLRDLGVRLSKQTVLFNEDSKAFSDRRLNPFRADEAVKVPPLDFEAGLAAWRVGRASLAGTELPPNRIREGLRILAHSVGRPPEQADEARGGAPHALDMAIRFPRPIYYEPTKGQTTARDPTFLVTAEGWNDNQPYPVKGHKPHFEPPKKDDPDNGTPEEKRRAAFPVGVAVEAPVPGSESGGTMRTVRLAVIGQGDVFVGDELPPAKERLFLQTANWLLGRDDFLPQADYPWSYPRVDLTPSSSEEQLWLWGTRLGLPVLFAYLGLVVLLVRRLR